MSDYTKLVNFSAKDALPSGDPGKVVKGTEINTEFANIQTAVNSKANKNNPTFTGTATIPTLNVTGNATISGDINLSGDIVVDRISGGTY